jgi:cellulose synthase/poly-beta-1,6-N-acetylglucosamine synthase-like glycosyltransferase
MKIFIAIPAIDEFEHLPELINDLKLQTYKVFSVFICVNNPEEWRNDPEKANICENNAKTMDYLGSVKDLDISVIDRSSIGKGWKWKQRGVGYARKELFEAIDRVADDNDIVISLDADTRIRPGFISSVRKQFLDLKKALLLTNPYYHKLTGNDTLDRAILRYELYMRYYLINLLMINSPYAFSALGSAISFRVSGYRKISGITPKEAGEDFYFVNRMKKQAKY